MPKNKTIIFNINQLDNKYKNGTIPPRKEPRVLQVSPDGRILIVGVKPSNFPDWRENRKFVFWHSEHEHSSKYNQIPNKVEVVLFTRFVSHAVKDKVTTLAKKAGVNFFRFVHGIGEIKKLVGESGILNQPVVATETPLDMLEESATSMSEAMPKTQEVVVLETNKDRKGGEMPKMKKGAIKEFVLSKANPSASNVQEEASRLLGLAEEIGLQTTQRYLVLCLYLMRRKTKTDKTSNVEGRVQTTSTKRRKKRGDSIRAIESFLASAEIVAVAIEEILEENARLREENTALNSKLKQLRVAFRSI